MKTVHVVLVAAAALALGACAPRAHAQDVITSKGVLVTDTEKASEVRDSAMEPGMRSPQTATYLSLVGTALPVAIGLIGASSSSSDGGYGLLVVGGYLMGPSLGHLYAGRGGHAAGGFGMRVASLVGVGIAIGTSWNGNNAGSDATAAASLALGSVSTIYDIATAARSARRHNDKVRGSGLSVYPAAVGAAHAPGLQADWSF
jgi:hypothetical protein